MTTIDSSFIADGFPRGIGPRVTIGFYANAQTRRPSALSGPFAVGSLGVGGSAGVYGATDDTAIPPTATNWDQAGVVGTSNNQHGVFGISSTRCGVMGQWGAKPTLGPYTPKAAVGGVAADADGVAGASDNARGVVGRSFRDAGVRGEGNLGPGVEGYASRSSGVSGYTAAGLPTFPPAGFDWQAGVSGQAEDHPAVTGWSINQYAFQGVSTNNTGVLGVAHARGPGIPPPFAGAGAGVVGTSDIYPGVVGTSNYVGLYGYCGGMVHGPGVLGVAGGNGPTLPPVVSVAGVIGSSDQHAGVVGTSNRVGVYGYCGTPDPESGAAGNAVEGHSVSGTGALGVAGAQGPVPTVVGNIAGVVGSSDQHTGIIGTSTNAVGVVGYSETQMGVYAETGATGTGSYAGYFKGNLFVSGRIDAGVKDAIVPFPDGTHRLLHCMESPEHWFEDFGAAKLKRGRAVVKLDANFAKVIKRGDYKVFVTPEGDCRGLYVRKSAASFEVRELGGGTSNVAFSYRIVGRRKDIRGHRRFAKINVTLPVFPGRRRPPRGKLLARSRKGAGATPARRRRRRGKRA